MRLGNYLSSLTKPELNELRELLNLTDDEEMIFNELSKGRSKIFIADKCLLSASTIDRRIKAIVCKIEKLKG